MCDIACMCTRSARFCLSSVTWGCTIVFSYGYAHRRCKKASRLASKQGKKQGEIGPRHKGTTWPCASSSRDDDDQRIHTTSYIYIEQARCTSTHIYKHQARCIYRPIDEYVTNNAHHFGFTPCKHLKLFGLKELFTKHLPIKRRSLISELFSIHHLRYN